ncbi:unnamed protein product [Brassica napus]|uniref:(rape) hypothetical protein n=1 Tax=Brassica napus TaxID=3708 RepID=A0A816S9Z1_BRANA|nr:unnamed protein product [Brassica napus]
MDTQTGGKRLKKRRIAQAYVCHSHLRYLLENPTRTLQAASRHILCQKRGYFRPFQPKEIELRLLLSLIG